MRRLLAVVGGILLVLLTSGCIVEAESSLSDPDPAVADPRLVGHWYYAGRNEFSVVSITEDRQNPGQIRILYTTIKPGADAAVASVSYVGWRTVLNGRSYLNLRRTGGTILERPTATFLAYDYTPEGALVLRLLNPKRVIAAIEAGKLEGRFKTTAYSDEAVITSSRDRLVAFIAGPEGESLFSDNSEPLHRARDAAN